MEADQQDPDKTVDCASVYPGLPGCLQDESLVDGRLAFVDERFPFDGRPTIVGLGQGRVETLGEQPSSLRGWSPSGAYLLTSHVYRDDGERMASFEALGACKRPFWAPPGAFPAPNDWLICQTENGRLDARTLPEGEVRLLLPSGTLTPDTPDTILLSGDGLLAWTPGLDALAEARSWVQELYVRPVDSGEDPTVLHLSDDIRTTYYQLVDWVPGTRLILAGRGMLSASLWVDGISLVTVDADTGEIGDLGAVMLLTPEAYAWHPRRPGLLALAAGGGRFINTNKRLTLLDVTHGDHGDPTYLSGEEQVAFAPAWSPDGTCLAYAGAASAGVIGDGETMEQTLQGRAIYIVNPETRERHPLTEPGHAIDGWPRWSADGQHLLYTRQQKGHTDVRVVAVDGSSDELLLTGLADPPCFYGGCGWDRMLAYSP